MFTCVVAVVVPACLQDETTRPTPRLDVHRRFLHHEHPGDAGLPSTYAEALYDRPEVSLVAAADRDANRLAAFEQRYSGRDGEDVVKTFQDAAEMLQQLRPDVVASASHAPLALS